MKTLSQVKFFSGIHQDIAILEGEINQWLEDNPEIEIKQLTQSGFGSKRGWDMVVTFLYTAPVKARGKTAASMIESNKLIA